MGALLFTLLSKVILQYALQQVIVDSEVRGTTPEKLILMRYVLRYGRYVIFWSSIFYIFRYVEGGVLGNNNIST